MTTVNECYLSIKKGDGGQMQQMWRGLIDFRYEKKVTSGIMKKVNLHYSFIW